MPAAIDLIGKVFGHLNIIERVGHVGTKRSWLAKCNCGNTKITTSDSLSKNVVGSCGCVISERKTKMLLERNTTHNKSNSKVYRTWHDMNRRCKDPKRKDFKRYGANGITVSKEWENFENFLNDMGEPPVGTTLDRINSTKGYSKENCRWANIIQQANNRSNNHLVLIEGEKLTMAEISRKYKIPYNIVRHKVCKYKFTGEDLLKLVAS